MNQTKNARLMMILSMAIFGTLAPFVRRISVSSGELALYRALLAAAMISVYLFFSGDRIPFRHIRRDLPLLLFSGVAMGFNWILLFEAYKYTTVSAATLCYYFAPVIVTAVCPFLFKEKLTARQILCFAMSTLGIVLITGGSGTQQSQAGLIGILFALGAAVLYAGVVLINKFIRNVEGIHRTLLQFLAASCVLVPYVAMTGGVTLAGMDAAGWICLMVVGLVHTGVAYCMYFSALRSIPGQKAAILSYIDPLVAVLVSVLVLREDMSMMQLLGGALVLGFTLLNEFSASKH